MNQGLGNVLLGVAARDIFVDKPKAKSKTVPPEWDFNPRCSCGTVTNGTAYSEGRYKMKGPNEAQAICTVCYQKRSNR